MPLDHHVPRSNRQPYYQGTAKYVQGFSLEKASLNFSVDLSLFVPSAYLLVHRVLEICGHDPDCIPEEVPNSADIEIHHWNGPDDPENPYDYENHNRRLDVYACD